MTEQQPPRSSPWGRADTPGGERDEARNARSVLGLAEPITFNPREHSTPGLYPKLSHGEGNMLLGRRSIKFMTPDQDNLEVSLTNKDNFCIV